MLNTVFARIDRDALRRNLDTVRRLCPQSRVMAMVKADAYGHGLRQVARALRDADGLAVARLQEAIFLREAGTTQRILLLATLLSAEDLQCCSASHIDVTAHDPVSVAAILAQANVAPLRVWLKLDSGMHRAGLDPEAFVAADRLLSAHPGIIELIHFTHFSNALDRTTTDAQLARVAGCRTLSTRAPLSLANSAALITRPDTRTDWVRPGIMLYGDNPASATHSVPLLAVMTMSARIVSIREIDACESVGYNSRWISARRSRIGTIGIGYGDGYPRHAPTGTPVWLDGERVPLVGQVSMDSLAIDITDSANVSVGAEAILWGRELPAALVADRAGTISYELFTSVSARVTRVYAGE